MGGCAVAICSSSCKNKGVGIKFHRFPRDAKLSRKWAKLCRRKDPFNITHATVCSAHFTTDDYVRDLKAELLGLPPRRQLKPDAVPSLNLLPESPVEEVDSDEVSERAARLNRRRFSKKIAEINSKQPVKYDISQVYDSLSTTANGKSIFSKEGGSIEAKCGSSKTKPFKANTVPQNKAINAKRSEKCTTSSSNKKRKLVNASVTNSNEKKVSKRKRKEDGSVSVSSDVKRQKGWKRKQFDDSMVSDEEAISDMEVPFQMNDIECKMCEVHKTVMATLLTELSAKQNKCDKSTMTMTGQESSVVEQLRRKIRIYEAREKWLSSRCALMEAKVHHLRNLISSEKKVVESIKSDKATTKTNAEITQAVQKIFSENQIKLLRNAGSKIRWTEDEIHNALALQSISKKAYQYLRQKGLPFPSLKAVKNWRCRHKKKQDATEQIHSGHDQAKNQDPDYLHVGECSSNSGGLQILEYPESDTLKQAVCATFGSSGIIGESDIVDAPDESDVVDAPDESDVADALDESDLVVDVLDESDLVVDVLDESDDGDALDESDVDAPDESQEIVVLTKESQESVYCPDGSQGIVNPFKGVRSTEIKNIAESYQNKNGNLSESPTCIRGSEFVSGALSKTVEKKNDNVLLPCYKGVSTSTPGLVYIVTPNVSTLHNSETRTVKDSKLTNPFTCDGKRQILLSKSQVLKDVVVVSLCNNRIISTPSHQTGTIVYTNEADSAKVVK